VLARASDSAEEPQEGVMLMTLATDCLETLALEARCSTSCRRGAIRTSLVRQEQVSQVEVSRLETLARQKMLAWRET
jgi:hypothetical protein